MKPLPLSTGFLATTATFRQQFSRANLLLAKPSAIIAVNNIFLGNTEPYIKVCSLTQIHSEEFKLMTLSV